jgi:hypothetical protein
MSLPKSSARRNRERGSVLLVAMIALVALISLGSLTIVTVRSALSGSTHDRFKAVALSAAEAGLAVGIDYARRNLQQTGLWSGLVNGYQALPHKPPHPTLVGNAVKPGVPGNIFSPDTNAWYEVEFLNNRDDGPVVPEGSGLIHEGYRDGNDTDGRIIIRSTGHGPNNASVRLELEIQTPAVSGTPCGSGGATNAGNDPCGHVSGGSTIGNL